MYLRVHAIHHRSVSPTSWSGLSMHPVEHLLYFSTLAVFLVLPSHPVHMLFLLFWQLLGAPSGHSGFDAVSVAGRRVLALDPFFHHLHHRFFECNYGSGEFPLDRWLDTRHDGSGEATEAIQAAGARIGADPQGADPGFDLEFGTAFWRLLPAFVFVTLIGATETIGDSIAIQRVAWRKPRAVDFRAVQGAVAADGAGNLLSGLAGTVPNTTYSTSIAITELTGVAARSVGVWIGIVFAAAAFLPKVSALLLAIPSPVAAAYVTVLLSPPVRARDADRRAGRGWTTARRRSREPPSGSEWDSRTR